MEEQQLDNLRGKVIKEPQNGAYLSITSGCIHVQINTDNYDLHISKLAQPVHKQNNNSTRILLHQHTRLYNKKKLKGNTRPSVGNLV